MPHPEARRSYTLVVTGAPYTSQAPATALAFCQALLDSGHSCNRLFLYGDGIYLASALNTPPPDETNWTAAWQALLTDHEIPAVACIASCLRRGLLNDEEAARYQRSAANLAHGFTIAGLGEWVESEASSDRVIYFHGGA